LDIRDSDELYSGFLLCEEKVNKGDWAYYCEGCYFVAHMSCSNPEVRPLYTDLLSENPIYSIVREESNRNESEMDIEASSSKTQDIGRGNFEQMPIDLERGRARKIERGSEKSNTAEFRLFTHQLPFLLFYEEMDINVFCRACQVPVGGLTYTRTSCDIFLHKTCVDFPQEIQDPLHNCEDYLILMVQEHSYKCMACDLNCFAFSFHCNSCKFEVHFSCASIRGLHKSEGPDPKNYKHDSHEHFLGIVYCTRNPLPS
jgi:hypothetical protein